MGKTKYVTAAFSAVGMLLLILDGKTATTGAAEGIDLCIRSVIPSLFPFFVLSGMLTGTLLGSRMPFLRLVGRIFKISEGTESLLLTGFLGGYPVGAQSIAQAWRAGQLSKEDAQRMLAFCNNAGPSFLFGIIAPMFTDSKKAWLLWGIHILSAFMVSICLPAQKNRVSLHCQSSVSIFAAMRNALQVTATVCGWVILFRIVIRFLDRWFLWIFPREWKIMAMGILELTNGCCELSRIPDEGLRFLICAGILGFGGTCVTMQTVSVTHGLSLDLYFPGKLMQGALSMIFALIMVPSAAYPHYYPLFLCLIVAVSGLYLRKRQKNSSNSQPVGV